MNYSKILNPSKTSQSKKAKEEQVANSAGGYTFALDKWAYLDRFLILGAEGNTYYTEQRELVERAAGNTIACIKEDGARAVARVVEISDSGRAAKNAPALFALALAAKHGDLLTRQLAHEATNRVARTFDDLVGLLANRKALGLGWGRGWRQAVAQWYMGKHADKLAYQVEKYQNRRGYSHLDMLRLSHPKSDSVAFNELASYLKTGEVGDRSQQIVRAHYAAKQAKSEADITRLIRENGLTHEMIPNEWKDKPGVWEALLEEMPVTATIRNLGKMTSIGLLGPLSNANKVVVERLSNAEQIRRSRVHPMTILVARNTYGSGAGVLGDLTWRPAQPILAALEEAMFLSFGNAEPTGKRILLAVDVSGSMSARAVPEHIKKEAARRRKQINEAAYPSVREAAAVMALVIARNETNYHITAFSETMRELEIHNRTSLADCTRILNDQNFGATDCALPMLYALGQNGQTGRTNMGWGQYQRTHNGGQRMEVDAFQIITDNETWVGDIHPFQALKEYRQEFGLPAKLVVWAMTATGFSIADPKDAGSLDVVGFDTSAPSIVADFIRQGE